jgi:hypothetical protein
MCVVHHQSRPTPDGWPAQLADPAWSPEAFVLPLLLGGGMQLTPSVSADTRLTLARRHALPTGAVELVYACA